MAWIKVNTDELNSAAVAIERYASSHGKQTREAQNALDGLGSQWEGPDYQYAVQHWHQMEHTISAPLLRNLRTQAEDLRWAAKQYEAAQRRAINRARML